MQWSMPQPVLRVIAGLIGLIAITAFAMGIINAPSRGRMPGEKLPGETVAAPLEATEATPLSQERIEGPPPPAPLTDEQKAKIEADKEAKAEADAAAKLAVEAAKPLPVPPPAPAQDRVGELLQNNNPPPSDDPPH
jgi:hypothetical protein